MNRLTSEELREMREYLKGVQPAPWRIGKYTDVEAPSEFGDRNIVFREVGDGPDAQFIVRARTDMPRLLDEVERLTSEVKRERDANDGLLDIIRDLVELHEDDVVERPAVALAKSVLIGK